MQWGRLFTTEEILEGRKKTKEYREQYYARASEEEPKPLREETASRSRVVEKLKKLWRRILKSSRE